jgi:hypothetical protein
LFLIICCENPPKTKEWVILEEFFEKENRKADLNRLIRGSPGIYASLIDSDEA